MPPFAGVGEARMTHPTIGPFPAVEASLGVIYWRIGRTQPQKVPERCFSIYRADPRLEDKSVNRENIYKHFCGALSGGFGSCKLLLSIFSSGAPQSPETGFLVQNLDIFQSC